MHTEVPFAIASIVPAEESIGRSNQARRERTRRATHPRWRQPFQYVTSSTGRRTAGLNSAPIV